MFVCGAETDRSRVSIGLSLYLNYKCLYYFNFLIGLFYEYKKLKSISSLLDMYVFHDRSITHIEYD